MVAVVLTLDDLAIRNRLAALDVAAGDLSPLMDAVGETLLRSARDRIEATNVSPDGIPWPPSFRARLDGTKTLYLSGRLRDSITYRAGRRQVEVGSGLKPYAAVHQTGATIVPKDKGALRFALADGTVVVARSVTIPARPYLGVSAEDGTEIVALAGDFFAAAAAGAAT